jgi:4-amino-4-deoxychorismate lyase
MSRFIESIRIEHGHPALLAYHMARVRDTVRHFYEIEPGWDLPGLVATLTANDNRVSPDTIYKCRIAYDERSADVNFQPYTIQEIRSLKLVEGGNLDYEFKYADRTRINALFAQRQGKDDILIGCNGQVTDTSYGNIAFLDKNDEWVTPESCLLNGIMRRYLIETGRIIERKITPGKLADYVSFRIINALRGWDTAPSEVSNID